MRLVKGRSVKQLVPKTQTSMSDEEIRIKLRKAEVCKV